MEGPRFWGRCDDYDHLIDTPEHYYVCLDGGSVSDRARLARTTPDAAVPGPGDRVYQPSLWDSDREDPTYPRVTVLTRDELVGKRLRIVHQIRTLQNMPSMEMLQAELEHVNFLLGDS